MNYVSFQSNYKNYIIGLLRRIIYKHLYRKVSRKSTEHNIYYLAGKENV